MKLNKFIAFLMIVLSYTLKAEELRTAFDSANARYSRGKYDQAIKMYEDILAKGEESAALYFNLGNAYLKSNELGHAILNYERAKRLDPDDEEINSNIKLANQRTEDKIEPAPQLFLAQWENGVTDIMTERSWSYFLITFLFISFIMFSFYIMSKNKNLKQFGFFGGLIVIILSIFTFFMARSKYENTVNSSSAIITSASVTVTGSPSSQGTKLFILHEGTKVKITDHNGDWTEIKIANGNVGWIKNTAIESI